ncbi:MAG: ATP synthase epsilon chain [Syntrophus sp. PtaB.Bin001]|jgi:F-type H+-transporting ATPase subunit epsilon|nr:MAG: ATP synthase epsilon chain [Syntrophus sp. PtaB.Bin001]
MAEEILLEIVTPEQMAFSGQVEEVTIPGTEGEFGVLRGHESLLSSVEIGELCIIEGTKKRFYAVNKGFAEVTANKVTVLVETAESAEQINKERALRAKERAEEKISKLSREDLEFELINLALMRAINRINVADKSQ